MINQGWKVEIWDDGRTVLVCEDNLHGNDISLELDPENNCVYELAYDEVQVDFVRGKKIENLAYYLVYEC